MKFETGFQRIFKKRYDGLIQEYLVHMLLSIDDAGNQTTKHDKTIVGGVYRLARDSNERSRLGEAIYHDPDDGVDKRIIMIAPPPRSV